MKELGQQIKHFDQLEAGRRYVSEHYRGTKIDPFRGHPFVVLSQPFWAKNNFNDHSDIHVVVEVEGYNGPTGGICWTVEGLGVGLLAVETGQPIRAQAVPIARLGLEGGRSIPRSNETYLLP